MAYDVSKMKLSLRSLLLIVLVLIELWLLAAFFPNRWQQRMYSQLDRVWPLHSTDYSRVTHPALKQELRPFGPLGLAVLGILALVNGGVTIVLWNRQNPRMQG